MAALAVVLVLLAWPARRLHSENLVVYLPHESKLIPIERIGSTAYLPLIPLLNLRGPVSGMEEKRNSLKVWVEGSQLQFHLNRPKIQIGKQSVTLSAPVLRVNGEWMVPKGFLSQAYPRLAGAAIAYQPGSDRAFLDGVQPVSYTVRLVSQPAGAELILQFTGPISAESASRNGKWLVFLRGAAIEPLEPAIRFNNPYVKELQFNDQDGHPKLIITPGVPNLNFYPVLTNGQRVLQLDFKTAPGELKAAVKPNQAQPPAGAVRPPGALPKPAAAKTAPPPPPPPPLPVVVLDAGHGGPDSGARSKDGVLEKNIVASLAAQVSAALQSSHKFRVVLCRPGDSDPTIEDRTQTANTSHPVAFVTFHAGDMGDQSPVVRVYTYQPSSPLAASGAPAAPVLFVPWDTAQIAQLTQSNVLAADLVQRFSSLSGVTVPKVMGAPVRQLRSISAPAVAVELGSLSPSMPAGELNQPSFQKQVAEAAAAALEQFAGGQSKP